MDVIAKIGSYAEYTVFSVWLRALGFKEDNHEGAPLCRWTHGALTLDVMPLDPQVLGLSNRWYLDALQTAGRLHCCNRQRVIAPTGRRKRFYGAEGVYVADSVRLLLTEPRFLDAQPGYLLPDEASQARIAQLLAKPRRLGDVR